MNLSVAAKAALLALLALPTAALASPLDAGRIPAEADGVGHLDLDALRKTSLHRLIGPKLKKEIEWQGVDPAIRPLARALLDTAQGVSFWLTNHDTGAVLIQVPDARRIQVLLDKIPHGAPIRIAGQSAYKYRFSPQSHKSDDTMIALVGNTFILSEDKASLTRAIDAAARRGKTLASARVVLDGALERGVFFFAALNDKLLDKVKNAAQSKTLRVNMSSLTVHVGEIRAEMRVRVKLQMSGAEEAQKIKSMIEGVVALVSMSDDTAEVRPFVKGLKVAVNGRAVEMTVTMPTADLVKLIESKN